MKVEHDGNGVPVVNVTKAGRGRLVRFFCRWCRANHTHPDAGLVMGKLSRALACHCTVTGGPYAAKGYRLRLVETPPSRVPRPRAEQRAPAG